MKLRYSIKAAALACLSLVAGCAPALGPTVPAPTTVPPGSVDDVASYAKDFLNAINPRSYTESREYCGFFVFVGDGKVVGTPPRAGTPDSCSYGYAPAGTIASYHTHGGFLPRYFNELPSVPDALSAARIGLTDFISTPGGRFWVVDGETGTSTMLCGRGCLSSDPNFKATPLDPKQSVYTVSELKSFQFRFR